MEFVRVNQRGLAEKASSLGVPGGPAGVTGQFWALEVGGDFVSSDIGMPDETLTPEEAFAGRVWGRTAPTALTRGEWVRIADLPSLDALVDGWKANAVPRQIDAACDFGGAFVDGPAVFWEFFVEPPPSAEEAALAALDAAYAEFGAGSAEFDDANERYIAVLEAA